MNPPGEGAVMESQRQNRWVSTLVDGAEVALVSADARADGAGAHR